MKKKWSPQEFVEILRENFFFCDDGDGKPKTNGEFPVVILELCDCHVPHRSRANAGPICFEIRVILSDRANSWEVAIF